MLCCRDFDVFVGVLDLFGKRHTANNVREALKTLFARVGISFEKAIAICTDSPSTMVKFRHDLRIIDKFTWILDFPCCLHVLSNLIKDLCKNDQISSIVSGCSKIVSFFNSSHYWLEESRKWMKVENVKKSLRTLCRTRWYSLSQVCLSVKCFQPFFFTAMLKSNSDPDSPEINREIQYLISPRFFESNSKLLDIVKPISDAIGRLENANSTISDVMVEIFKLAKALRSLPDDHPFKHIALPALSRRIEVFDNEIYFLSLFLSPNHRNFALSGKYSFQDLQIQCFKIVREMKWKKNEVILLKSELERYQSFEAPFATIETKSVVDVYLFWQEISLSAPYLSKFAKLFLSIKPHAARIEGLFSSLALAKPQRRNRLSVDKLVDLGRVKLSLQEEVNVLKNEYSNSSIGKERIKNDAKKRKTDHSVEINSEDDVFEKNVPNTVNNNEGIIDEEDESTDLFEDLLEELLDHQQLHGDIRQDFQLIDSLFDYDYVFNDREENSPRSDEDSNDDDDDDEWNVDDIIL